MKPLLKIESQAKDAIADAINSTQLIVDKTVKDATQIIKQPQLSINKDLEAAKKITADTLKPETTASPSETTASPSETTQVLTNKVENVTALPEDKALPNIPSDPSKYTLQADKSSWVLIEDNSQILYSDELQAGKIFTLPKVKDVIISLGDAGIINVYKGDKLLGKLGKADESLDLISIEQRLNQLQAQ